MTIKDENLFTLGMLYMLRSFGDYVLLPLLALFFNQKLSLIETSIIISVPAFFSMFFGFLGHLLLKRTDAKAALQISLILGIVSYLGYLTLSGFFLLFLSSLINGLSRSIWEPVTKSLFAFSSSGADTAFRVRYIVICIAGILGPSICAFLSNYSDSAYQFTTTISVYIIVIILIFPVVPNLRKKAMNTSAAIRIRGKGNLTDITAILSFRFISLIIGGSLVYTAFSQFEAIFPLYLHMYFDDAVNIFSALLVLNSIFSTLFQLLYMFISRKSKKQVSNKLIILFGNIAFTASFALFAKAGSTLYIYIIAICIYSLGEVLVIPATDIAIDEIAPPDKKSLYFGVAEIRVVGFTAGPILAGAVLQAAAPPTMCVITMLIFAASTLFFFLKQ